MLKNKIALSALLLGLALTTPFESALAGDSKKMESKALTKNASVYIISPKDGEVVSSPFVVKFGIKGMTVAPAGSDVPNSGHHHLLIDSTELPKAGEPMGKQVTHFGKGQTETELTLEKGEHTLQLILGDKSHVPHDPMIVSKPIKITVK